MDASAFRRRALHADPEVRAQGLLPVHRRIDCDEAWAQVSSLFGRQYRPLGSNK
jgi:hypothetical protein